MLWTWKEERDRCTNKRGTCIEWGCIGWTIPAIFQTRECDGNMIDHNRLSMIARRRSTLSKQSRFAKNFAPQGNVTGHRWRWHANVNRLRKHRRLCDNQRSRRSWNFRTVWRRLRCRVPYSVSWRVLDALGRRSPAWEPRTRKLSLVDTADGVSSPSPRPPWPSVSSKGSSRSPENERNTMTVIQSLR